MRKELFLFFAIILLAAIVFFQQQIPQKNCSSSAMQNAEVFFCPLENCAMQLISKISESKKSIDIAIYSFTHDEISSALINAKNRGVLVRVLMEKQQAGSDYSDDEKLMKAGIETKFMDNPQGIMHNKFAVFDSNIVATGSFNYTANADERNNENLVFLQGKEIALEFQQEFEKLWQGS